MLIPCPECRQKISEEAVNCPKCGRPLSDEDVDRAVQEAEKQKKVQNAVGMGCLAVVLVLMFAFRGCLSGTSGPPPGSETRGEPAGGASSGASVGSEARLHVDGLDTVMVAVDEQAFDEFTKASVAKDNIGIANLVLSGKLVEVPDNTRVLVVDMGLFRRKVRVLEGTHVGLAGWVPYEWVQ
jgi:hypothetical protein